MKPMLWNHDDLVNAENLTGHTVNLKGDAAGISGNVSNLSGDVTGLRGDVTGVHGSLDACELSDEERAAGIKVASLIRPPEAEADAGAQKK